MLCLVWASSWQCGQQGDIAGPTRVYLMTGKKSVGFTEQAAVVILLDRYKKLVRSHVQRAFEGRA